MLLLNIKLLLKVKIKNILIYVLNCIKIAPLIE